MNYPPIKGRIYCFRADYRASSAFDSRAIPEWLSVETNWQGYRIATQPWIADVARALGLLTIDDSADAWRSYLESLGLCGVVAIAAEEFFEDSLYGF